MVRGVVIRGGGGGGGGGRKLQRGKRKDVVMWQWRRHDLSPSTLVYIKAFLSWEAPHKKEQVTGSFYPLHVPSPAPCFLLCVRGVCAYPEDDTTSYIQTLMFVSLGSSMCFEKYIYKHYIHTYWVGMKVDVVCVCIWFLIITNNDKSYYIADTLLSPAFPCSTYIMSYFFS